MLARTGGLAALAALEALAALAALGCRKKPPPVATEKALVVKVARAPGLAELTPTSTAIRPVTWGEVYQERARTPDFHWSGVFDGHSDQRVGAIEVTRSAEDASRFAFQADLLEGDVPTRAWLCAQLPAKSAPARCADRLLRLVVADGVLFAYAPSWRVETPLIELVDGAAHTVSLPAISDARVVAIAGRPLALVTSHWGRGAAWTGTDVIAFLPRPALQRAGELHLDEIDGRDGTRATYWFGALEVRADALRVQGRRSVRDRRTDLEISGEVVDETWALEGDRLVKR
jgi:hypothetical protein